jgi:hypothetical protein
MQMILFPIEVIEAESVCICRVGGGGLEECYGDEFGEWGPCFCLGFGDGGVVGAFAVSLFTLVGNLNEFRR